MIKHITVAMAVFFTAVAMQADVLASELNVYPIPAIFSSQNLRNKAFKKTLEVKNKEFISIYTNLFNKYFPDANKEISDKTKYKTFAAYVNIPRASAHVINKGDSLLDLYLPLTVGMNFVNMATGETLYSCSKSNYLIYHSSELVSPEKRKENAIKLNTQNYSETLEGVIKTASENFKPFDITAKITDTYRNFYILDKGLEAGIAKGDMLTDEQFNQLSVIYSDLTYSAAAKVLGNPNIGGEFSKFSTASILQLRKPKVLFINDYGDEQLYNIFSSELGDAAQFSLITTDKTFYDMQAALVSLNMNFKNSNIYKRTLPDYFLKLYFIRPMYAQFKSNVAYLNVDKYGMLACGVIFDNAGRVVFSECVNEEKENPIVGDIRFQSEDIQEILGKEIISKLAKSMQQDIKFKNTVFKIKSVSGNTMTVADPGGFLMKDSVLTVFKKVSTEKSGDLITVPTWDYKVINSQNGVALCEMSKPYIDGIDYPSKRDLISITAITGGANKANMYNYIPEGITLEGNEVELRNFANIAFAALTSSIKAPVAMQPKDFSEQLGELQGFKKRVEIAPNDSNLSIKAVYKTTLKNQERKGKAVLKTYEITVGLVAQDGGNIIKQKDVTQTVSFIEPKDAEDDRVTQYELTKAMYPLIKQLASKF